MSLARRISMLLGSSVAVAGLVVAASAPAFAAPVSGDGCWCVQNDGATPDSSAPMNALRSGPSGDASVSGGEVSANDVLIHQWPQPGAPVVGVANRGNYVAVLNWYTDYDEILYGGQEAWISARYVFSVGTGY